MNDNSYILYHVNNKIWLMVDYQRRQISPKFYKWQKHREWEPKEQKPGWKNWRLGSKYRRHSERSRKEGRSSTKEGRFWCLTAGFFVDVPKNTKPSIGYCNFEPMDPPKVWERLSVLPRGRRGWVTYVVAGLRMERSGDQAVGWIGTRLIHTAVKLRSDA